MATIGFHLPFPKQMQSVQRHIPPLGNYDVPTGWPMKPYKRPHGGTPGPPVMYEKPSDPEEESAGYGYSNGMNQQERDVFFYHSDHLGSTSYITDANGEATQFVCYKPYGEALVDEHNTSYEQPWKFNGKELDAETGLYYYGACYYEPVLALWYGVDALTEKYPSMGGYVYCAGNPVRFVDVDGNAPKSRIEYRGNGTFGINKNNMSRFSRFYMNLANNDPSCWRSGEIGLNTTILSFSYKPYQYDKKLPGIDPADRNRTFSNDATPLTQKGLPDRRYKPRMATYSYMGNVPTASGKAFAVGSLAIDVTIMGLQSAQSYMMLSDLDALNTQKNSLTDAFFFCKTIRFEWRHSSSRI